jgi:hypothetical protein
MLMRVRYLRKSKRKQGNKSARMSARTRLSRRKIHPSTSAVSAPASRRRKWKGGTSNPFPDIGSFFSAVGFNVTQLIGPLSVGVQPVASNQQLFDPRATTQFNSVPLARI